ncbi:response regulator transcription factor [Rhabdothermincola sediminis]|uniref:response regulator transcription factor n=1 Tax=Rhabdothermincola sediminis TaxID=2751370 RepID=UPI0027DA6187|nr:response regulator transcription factor [Rhabdothermincola sediminis]
MPRILVVEDDPHLRQALRRALDLDGYDVEEASDGLAGLEGIEGAQWDAVVLDMMMPYLSGLDVCRRLRERGNRTPILMLTARHETADRVAGLDAGADDYLVKPFALDELLARLRALIRRASPTNDGVIEAGDLRIDRRSRRVMRGERELVLTKTEFELLSLLAEHAGQVLTRDLIFERIWGYAFETSSNSLDVYIGYLRRKTEQYGDPRLIHTVRGVGYVLRAGDE